MGASPTAKQRRSKGSAPTVAVVDDDPAIRRALTRLLKSAGFQVVAVPSGEELIAVFDVVRPSSMIVDLRLAGMSGTQLVERISETGKLPPTIFMTGHLDAWKSLEGRGHHALACLQKPFDEALLLDLLERVTQEPHPTGG
jgi:FixJ family two-component response regulator